MKVIYLNEYNEELLAKEGTFIPRVNDTVPIGDENLLVEEVIWNPATEVAVVVLGEPRIVKSGKKEVDLSGRLNEMNRSILELSKRQDASEKKNRLLNEQLVSVRTAIRNQPKPKTRSE
jgi:hypothetical protein